MMKTPRVLMVGPGRCEKGGIAAVVDTYFKLGIESRTSFRYIDSYLDGGKLKKVCVFASAYVRVFAAMKKFDILHVHMASYASFTRKAKIVELAHKHNKKIVIHQHGGAFDKFYHDSSAEEKAYIRRIFSYASKVFVMSGEWYDFFVDEICDKNKVEVLFNGVIFPKIEQKNYENHNLLFLGRLETKKGVYELLEAMPDIKAHFPDVQLYIGGYGEQEKMQRIATNLCIADCVHFAGWVVDEQKIDLMEKCSLFILPSYTEGLPVSVLEAMSYGLIPIATHVGGIPGVITNGENGFLMPPHQSEAIVSTVCSIIGNTARKIVTGRKARDCIELKFNAKDNLERVLQVYDELIRGDLI